MRIALIGQSTFGAAVLNALVDQGENLVGLFCPSAKEGRPVDPIITAAEDHKVAVHQFDRMRDIEAISAFSNLSPDLCVMAYVTDIVPEQILKAPSLGTIQYHPSLLPKHRGPSSINWAVINGESKTGLTVFWPDNGLDTGPVLLQKKVAISPDETTGSLYFDKLFPLGVDALIEAVGKVKNGTAQKIEQDHSKASYEGWCKASDVVIDWTKPVDELYDLIRGSDPSPGSGAMFRGAEVRFYQTAKRDGDTGRPAGEVIAVDDLGFTVAAHGGVITVRRVRPSGQKKLSASEWAATSRLKAGDRFVNG
jgi:methionyl-tRNA formyltransferase